MKKTIRLFALTMLVLSLMLGAAIAEEAVPETAQPKFNLLDRTLVIGKNSYTFPMTIEQCKEAGLNIGDFDPIAEGKHDMNVHADNGRRAFTLDVYNIGGEHWALGFTINQYDCKGASIGGMTLGETKQSEVIAELGDDSSFVRLYYALSWHPYYEGEGDAATLSRLTYYCKTPMTYGVVQTTLTPDAEQADPFEMSFNEYILAGKLYKAGDTVQTMLDAGWVMSIEDAAEKIEPDSYNVMHLFGGDCIVEVSAYNASAEAKPVSECIISSVTVNTEDVYPTLILADGLTLGSTDEEMADVFSSISWESSKNAPGELSRNYKLLNRFTLETKSENGAVVSIKLNRLEN